MASEGAQREAAPAQGPVRPLGDSDPLRPAAAGSEVVATEVERALVELLRGYRAALKFAADMPVLGRCAVSGSGLGWRWGARFFTRLYVETHVRKHLLAIRSQLRLELLATTAPEEQERIRSLEADLAGKVEPLLGWRRLAGVITRLPPVAAVLPVLSAVAAFPVGDELSWQINLDSVVALVATAVVVWVLVVWPSIRLGFRLKRAVFCGGRDLHHPLWFSPGELRWLGFATAKVYDDAGKLWVELFREVTGRKQRQAGRHDLPTGSVYEAEDAVYQALGRRKPGEFPVDMLLGFPLYLWFAFAALVVIGLVETVASGFDVPASFWLLVPLALLIPMMPFQFVLQALRNYRLRPH